MILWIGHLIRIRDVDVEGILVNKEPLRIGAGKEVKLGSPVDMLLKVYMPDMGEVPFIPGSSLKGVFRSYFDTIVRSLGGYTCPGSGGNTCMMQNITYYGEIASLEKIARKLSMEAEKDPSKLSELRRLLWDNLCLSCKVFGSQSYRSKIVFYDSYPIGDLRIGVKRGIAINRRTGAAMHKALYQVEYVEPGSQFGFHVKLLDVPNYILGLFSQGLYELNSGRLKIGGFKTRGFGWVELRNPRITITFYGSRGGSVKDNKLVLNPMDDIDEEYSSEFNVSINQIGGATRTVIEGNNAWKLFEGLITLWNNVKEKVVKAHTPRWYSSVAF